MTTIENKTQQGPLSFDEILKSTLQIAVQTHPFYASIHFVCNIFCANIFKQYIFFILCFFMALS